MEDMVGERMKKEYGERMKSIADSRAARVNKNPEFVPKFQDSNVKRSALKYWRRTYRNIRPPDTGRVRRHLERDRRTCSKDHPERERSMGTRTRKGTGQSPRTRQRQRQRRQGETAQMA